MKLILTLVFALIFPLSLWASEATEAVEQENAAPVTEEVDGEGPDDAQTPDPDTTLLFIDAREADVQEYIWTRRIIVVMANTPEDPQFNRQLDALRDRADEFVARDAVVIFDAHPEDRSTLRQVMRPRSFMTAIIDKDGEVKARRPSVRSGRELMAVIDRFPSRRQEILERQPAGR